MTTIAEINSNGILSWVRPSISFRSNKVRNVQNQIVGYADSSGNIAYCPGCKESLRPKICTNINDHWSHFSGSDCAFATAPETEWHRRWKAHLPPSNVEVMFESNRADIVSIAKAVVELQHSYISVDEILSRIEAYRVNTAYRDTLLHRDLYWLFDATNRANTFRAVGNCENVFRFHWKNPRKNWLAAEPQTLLFDLGDSVLFVLNHPSTWSSEDGECIIDAIILKPQEFVDVFLLAPDFSQIDALVKHYNDIINDPRNRCQGCHKSAFKDGCKVCGKWACNQCNLKNREYTGPCSYIPYEHSFISCKYCGNDICSHCVYLCCPEFCRGCDVKNGHRRCGGCRDAICREYHPDGKTVLVICEEERCSKARCLQCSRRCYSCKAYFCEDCYFPCSGCQNNFCHDCSKQKCSVCQENKYSRWQELRDCNCYHTPPKTCDLEKCDFVACHECLIICQDCPSRISKATAETRPSNYCTNHISPCKNCGQHKCHNCLSQEKYCQGCYWKVYKICPDCSCHTQEVFRCYNCEELYCRSCVEMEASGSLNFELCRDCCSKIVRCSCTKIATTSCKLCNDGKCETCCNSCAWCSDNFCEGCITPKRLSRFINCKPHLIMQEKRGALGVER